MRNFKTGLWIIFVITRDVSEFVFFIVLVTVKKVFDVLITLKATTFFSSAIHYAFELIVNDIWKLNVSQQGLISQLK